MRIKKQRKEKWVFIVFPMRCWGYRDEIYLEKMLLVKIPLPNKWEKRYYCKECAIDIS